MLHFDHRQLEAYSAKLEQRTQLRMVQRKLVQLPIPTHALPQVKRLNLHTLHIAHRIATGIDEPQGFRQHPAFTQLDARITYQAPPSSEVPDMVRELLARLADACQWTLNDVELMYYAAQLHACVLCIHPYADGNGRLARLLERWFIAQQRGTWAWHLGTDAYYRANRTAYLQSLAAIGPNWRNLRWERAMPFMLMLPAAIAHQVDT